MGRGGPNYYEVLDVPPDADPKEVRQGYIRVKNTYSQDSIALYSLMGGKEREEALGLVEEAYMVLGDTEKRRGYDDSLGINRGVNFQVPKESRQGPRPAPQGEAPPPRPSMPKLAASKKFVLDYEADPGVEQEIEGATEFTGPLLRRIREYKNVDLARMAELTRVSKHYLRRIEGEDFGALPAPVYVRGFVFQYAKCLRLDPDIVSTSYVHRMKEAQKAG